MDMPDRIDKYDVRAIIGRGATSTVYHAYDAFAQRDVAVKVFNSSVLADPVHGKQFRKLLATEASLVGRLVHPHIVALLDAKLGADMNYLVMEYVDGGTLEQYASPDCLLPLDRVVEIGFKCALALDCALHAGVIHRDIKPANIMMCANGDIKLADFGAAALARSDQTQLVGIGSPLYMSPEQIRLDPLSHQTDIYSLGVVMYVLLTGYLPFSAENTIALTQLILTDEAEDVCVVRPAIPDRLGRIVARAMAKNTADRYASWTELAHDLAELAALELPQESLSDVERFKAVRDLPFFAGFDDVGVWEVLNFSVWERHQEGGVLVAEGDEGDYFFILADGEVRVSKAGKVLSTQGKGACFGEMCYIRQDGFRRSATVTAATPVTVMKVRSEALRRASENCQLAFNRAFLNGLVDRLAKANSDLVALG